MPAPAQPRGSLLMRGVHAVLVLVALMLSACGSSTSKGAADARAHFSAPVTRGSGVSAAEVGVIGGWADALRAGHQARAAAYWALPSTMVNGPEADGRLTIIRIRNVREAQRADESLSCGARLDGATRRGRYVEASFTLSVRTGAGASQSGCAGPARVDFLILAGHIARWLRAPVATAAPPGSGSPAGPVSQPI